MGGENNMTAIVNIGFGIMLILFFTGLIIYIVLTDIRDLLEKILEKFD